MNERIKELRKQAAREVSNANQWTNDDEWNELFMEKFAELIVGECLKIAKNREDELESAGLLEESNAVGIVAYRISRQFGVKR